MTTRQQFPNKYNKMKELMTPSYPYSDVIIIAFTDDDKKSNGRSFTESRSSKLMTSSLLASYLLAS